MLAFGAEIMEALESDVEVGTVSAVMKKSKLTGQDEIAVLVFAVILKPKQ